MNVYPVIMCGGSGTRLWPASTPARPKQFLPLTGERSLFEDTVLRVIGLAGASAPVIVSGARHAGHVRRQLDGLGVEADMLLEPAARDSAPAIAAAAAFIAARDPDGLAVIVSSDHHVPDAAAFRATVERALAVAQQGFIVTLGVRPDAPSTAYGYIRPGAAVGDAARAVAAFVEKPDRDLAERYVAEGYLWNTGNFLAKASVLLEELDAHAPEVSDAARHAVEGADGSRAAGWRLGEAFLAAPKISIDYAVMEKTARAAVAAADFAWSDLGAWDAVKRASAADADGNAVSGETKVIASQGVLVRAGGGVKVGVVGVRDIAVIAEPGAVLVAALDASQSVKQVAEALSGAAADPDPAARLKAHAERYGLWLRGSALPLWCAQGADHARGGYVEELDGTARPTRAVRRFRVQARQAIVYAEAGRAGWTGPWREAAGRGLAACFDRYRRSDGYFRTRVDEDGAVVDDSVLLYDQAFALLAMAAVHRASPEAEDLPARAAAHLARIEARFALPGGGYREEGEDPFKSDPIMHLFEAACAWSETDAPGPFPALAESLAHFAARRLVDPDRGFIREFYADGWAPADGEKGRIVWPGHQFEWAFLLQRWAERSGSAEAMTAASGLYAAGAAGVDPARSLALDALDADFRPTDRRARLWPQTERLRAALVLGAASRGEAAQRRLADAADAADGLWTYLADAPPGLWRDRVRAEGGFEPGPSPASSFYHLSGAVRALLDGRETA